MKTNMTLENHRMIFFQIGDTPLDSFMVGIFQLVMGKFLDLDVGRCQVRLPYLDVPLEVRIKGDRISGLFLQYIPFISR